MKSHVITLSLLALGASFLACSTTSESGDDPSLSDCESICQAAVSVNCGGEACLTECNNERSSAPDVCKDAADSYYSCARNTDSISCSSGFLSFYGCSDLQTAFYQCVANNQGDGGGGSTGSAGGEGGAPESVGGGVVEGGAGGAPAYVCESAESEGGMACNDPDPDNCICQGCGSKVCSAAVDCTCPGCAEDSFCTSSCYDNGICDPYFEGCGCSDCVAIPQCN